MTTVRGGPAPAHPRRNYPETTGPEGHSPSVRGGPAPAHPRRNYPETREADGHSPSGPVAKTPPAAEPGTPRAERVGAPLLCLGLAAGLATQVVLLWAAAGVRGTGGAPAAALAAALAAATGGRLLGWATPGAEAGLGGLVVGTGLPVAFTRADWRAAPLAGLAAAAVWLVWWLVGQAAEAVRSTLSDAAPDRPAPAPEVQGALFRPLALAGGLAMLAVAAGAPAAAAAAGLGLQTGCTCMLLALVHQRTLWTDARRQGAVVLPGLQVGGRGALAATAAAVALGLLLPPYPALLRPRHLLVFALAFHHLFSGAPVDRGSGPEPAAGTAAPLPPGGGAVRGLVLPPALVEGLTLALVVWALLVVFRLAVVWLYERLHRGLPNLRGLWSWALGLWRTLTELLALLLAEGGRTSIAVLLRRLWAMGRGGPGPAVRAAGTAAPPAAFGWARWRDPRARIRAAYRHLLEGARARGYPRPRWASPRAFHRLLRPALAGSPRALQTLTALYEEARYSPHPVDGAAAAAAEAAAEATVRGLTPRETDGVEAPGGPVF